MDQINRIFCFIFVSLALFSCSDTLKSNDKNIVSGHSYLDSVSADSCVHLLVQSTSINQQLKNELAKEDGISNDTMLIKLYHNTEVKPGSFIEAADGFINVDLKKKRVFYVNMTEEKLEEVTFDKVILQYYINTYVNAKKSGKI